MPDRNKLKFNILLAITSLQPITVARRSSASGQLDAGILGSNPVLSFCVVLSCGGRGLALG